MDALLQLDRWDLFIEVKYISNQMSLNVEILLLIYSIAFQLACNNGDLDIAKMLLKIEYLQSIKKNFGWRR